MRNRGLKSFAALAVSTPQVTGLSRPRRRSAADLVDYEALLDFQLRSTGMPPFERQFQFANGRKFAADFAQKEFRLLVEVQGGIWRRGGGAHSRPGMIERDVEKQQLAVLNGWHAFPVTTDEVKNGQALQLIGLALHALGWKK